jgi:hypothetical protein
MASREPTGLDLAKKTPNRYPSARSLTAMRSALFLGPWDSRGIVDVAQHDSFAGTLR